VLAGGALNGPQVAAAVLVVAGGLALLERKPPVVEQTPSAGNQAAFPFPLSASPMTADGSSAKDEAAHD
jgi:hypothetical protein